jgi:UDP-glucose 4-epimerase
MTASILVTGANGFLGRHVALCYARQGHEVLGIGHGEWPRSESESWGLSSWIQADITMESLLEAETPSTIIHCAGGGSVAFSITNPLVDFQRTVVTTAHVLEYVRLHAPSCRVVYPSSASVYGAVQAVPICEDCAAMPISQYGTHKLMAEEMVSSYARQFGTCAAIVRFFSVYGPGLRKQLLWDASCKLAVNDNTFMGTGEEVRDWLHVEDAANLLQMAATQASGKCPIVNGGSGVGATVREVLQHLACNLLRRQIDLRFSGVQRPGDPSRYIADIEASKAWGWFPKRQWPEGVEEYAAWWSETAG